MRLVHFLDILLSLSCFLIELRSKPKDFQEDSLRTVAPILLADLLGLPQDEDSLRTVAPILLADLLGLPQGRYLSVDQLN